MWLGPCELLHWKFVLHYFGLELLHLHVKGAVCYECIDSFTYLLPDCFFVFCPFVIIHIVKLLLVLIFIDGDGGLLRLLSSLMTRQLERRLMLKCQLSMHLLFVQERRLPQLFVKLLIPEAPEFL